jgi:hypothetical protein
MTDEFKAGYTIVLFFFYFFCFLSRLACPIPVVQLAYRKQKNTDEIHVIVLK